MMARPVSLLPFQGLMLTVLEAQGTQYIPFRPVVGLLGLDWKMARRTATRADNAELYDLQELECLPVDTYLGEPEAVEALVSCEICPAEDDSQGSQEANLGYKYPEKSLWTTQLCIRLERVYIYLARVNTAQMRSHGKVDAADWLRNGQAPFISMRRTALPSRQGNTSRSRICSPCVSTPAERRRSA